MKGIIILRSIAEGFESMRIVAQDEDAYDIGTLIRSNENKEGLWKVKLDDYTCNIAYNLNELRQPAVETSTEVFSLDQDDWKWALEHLEEEIEFTMVQKTNGLSVAKIVFVEEKSAN